MSDTSRICTTCGHIGEPASATPGSFRIEVLLWLCFLLPGFIYSLWRLNRRHDACAKCGAATLLPLDSPVARTFAAQHGLTADVSAAAVPLVPSRLAYGFGRWVGGLFRRRAPRQ